MLLIALSDIDEDAWRQRLSAHLGDYKIVLRGEDYRPEDIEYIFVWKPKPDAFAHLKNLKAILSLGAGVDALLNHEHLPDVPIVRFVERELTQCMSDYVVANVAMHHRGASHYLSEQKQRNWTQYYPPAAWDISVGIMGLGELGLDAAQRLQGLGYQINGWSRSAKDVAGVNLFHGQAQFDSFLGATDILVNLLPLTSETTGILNARTFAGLRRAMRGGPVIVNAARGGHQDEADIVEALETGVLGAASLDVFQVEPLPKDSPLWSAPNCFITPHIAAISNPDSGAEYFAHVLKTHEAGGELINVVDRAKGY